MARTSGTLTRCLLILNPEHLLSGRTALTGGYAHQASDRDQASDQNKEHGLLRTIPSRAGSASC
jgi:hypothetical protein